MNINPEFDVERTGLQIKTGSAPGSNKEINVLFTSAQSKHMAGGVRLKLYSEPEYVIWFCTESWYKIPTDLPTMTSNEVIWGIALLRNSDERRVKIYFNEKEVLNFQVSDTSCTHVLATAAGIFIGNTLWPTYILVITI